jgi:succinoglycan biosynthesis protein ExoM
LIGSLQPQTSVDVCVCTFRRPFLAETLKSIGNLQVDGLSVRVIVADNDFVPSAAPTVELIGQHFPFPITYVHAPAANISVARNACADVAEADFIAFVDDDETVSEGWLRHLVDVAVGQGAGVVLGPVHAEYDEAAPPWMRGGDFHSAAPVPVGGEIATGYTCNVLMRWSGSTRSQRFNLALGRSGGEDTEFFYRLHDAGVKFAQAPQAIVYEPVPPSRATLAWLMRRRFRSGQTYGARLLTTHESRLRALALAGAKVAYCLAASVVTLPAPVAWRRNFLRATLHLGVVAGLLRSRQAELYGDLDQTPAPSPNAAPIN